MLDERKRGRVIAAFHVDSGRADGEDGAVEGLGRFREQLDRTLAFGPGLVAAPQPGMDQAEERMARPIFGAFAHRRLRLQPRGLEFLARFGVVRQKRASRAEEIRLRDWRARFAARFLRRAPLQNLDPLCVLALEKVIIVAGERDRPVGIEIFRPGREELSGRPEIAPGIKINPRPAPVRFRGSYSATIPVAERGHAAFSIRPSAKLKTEFGRRLNPRYFKPVAKTVWKCGLSFSRETTVTSMPLKPAASSH